MSVQQILFTPQSLVFLPVAMLMPMFTLLAVDLMVFVCAQIYAANKRVQAMVAFKMASSSGASVLSNNQKVSTIAASAHQQQQQQQQQQQPAVTVATGSSR
ncbi:hypothetical protein GQ42DRAFT_160493 [Ramicandelaber brevisporus]|nr:hypothetical protein GQ42DRAFT_160493 [Ramicandelaber brevisporus]